ncbi:MAG: glycosyltransferase family protein [Calditrichota bacterium]
MKSCNVVTVIQARRGSSRLPDKVLRDICGKPLLIRMVERVKAATLAGTVVVATTTHKQDDRIEEVCNSEDILCFRGNELNLLDRHFQAGKAFDADAVVKIPSDCPLIDPKIIDQVIGKYLTDPEAYDYVSNLHPPTWPDGNDVEIMSMEALAAALNEAKLEHHLEHTTPFLWMNPEKFRIANVRWETGLDYSESHRWTIDYEEDYLLIASVYDELYPQKPLFGLEDILNLLTAHPEINAVNRAYLGEGWFKSYLQENNN